MYNKDLQEEDFEFIDTICTFIETLILVSAETTENSIDLLAKMFSKQLDANEMKKFIIKLKENFGTLKSYKAIVKLFEERIHWLKDKVAQEPVFSWKMSGSTGVTSVDKFLESEQQSFSYYNFAKISHARRFIYTYGGFKDNRYSVTMHECGRGQSSGVQITKTKELYESQVRKLKEFQSELAELTEFLKTHQTNE